jgi:hypothetical protein
MQQYKERYEQEIASHEEVLVSATTTPKDLEICNRKIALRVLEIHMLHALLNGDVLAWKTIKPLIDADDRCDALSGAEMEHAFIEYMKICIQRGLIKPVSA